MTRAAVFLARVRWDEAEVRARLTALSSADRQRARALTHPDRLRSFVAGRHLRALACQQLGLVPDTWGSSLSHSGDLVACLVAASRYCGVDLEAGPAPLRHLAIARRFFHPEEYQWLLATPDTARAALFQDVWTRKEACVKAWQRGLAHHLASVRFAPSALEPVAWPAEFASRPLRLMGWLGDDWRLTAAVHGPDPDWSLDELVL